MKKLILILMLLPVFSFGQKKLNAYIDHQIHSGIDSIQLQVSVNNYCLNKFKTEKIIGTSAQFVGLGIVFYAMNDRINGEEQLAKDIEYLVAVGNRGSLEEYLIKLRGMERDYNDLVDRNKNLLTTGSIIALSGTALNIIAHRWLKNSYVLPAEHGIGVQIKF